MTSGHDVLQHALTNQLLTFPPWQEVLWTETDVRMTTSCLTTVYDPDVINKMYSSSRRRSSFLFWPDCSSSAGSQFHRRFQTLRDPLNTSPGRHHEVIWSVSQQTDCQTSASPQILETSRVWQWSTNTSETEYRWVSPRCTDSSGASCPAWCPDPRPHPETAWRRPETSYTDWTTAAGTTHTHQLLPSTQTSPDFPAAWFIFLFLQCNRKWCHTHLLCTHVEADVGGQHAAILPAQRSDPQQAVVPAGEEKKSSAMRQKRRGSHDAQLSRCLQVGDDAALVPQQAAVTQFDGGNQLSSAFGLRLVTERRG